MAKDDISYDYDSGITSIKVVATYFKSLLVLDQFAKVYNIGTQTKIKFVTKHTYDAYMRVRDSEAVESNLVLIQFPD